MSHANVSHLSLTFVPESSKRRSLLLIGATVLLVACAVLVVCAGLPSRPGSAAAVNSQLLSSGQEYPSEGAAAAVFADLAAGA